jgi:hypothetical protein
MLRAILCVGRPDQDLPFQHSDSWRIQQSQSARMTSIIQWERLWAKPADLSQNPSASESASFERPARYMTASSPPVDSVSGQRDKAPATQRAIGVNAQRGEGAFS